MTDFWMLGKESIQRTGKTLRKVALCINLDLLAMAIIFIIKQEGGGVKGAFSPPKLIL